VPASGSAQARSLTAPLIARWIEVTATDHPILLAEVDFDSAGHVDPASIYQDDSLLSTIVSGDVSLFGPSQSWAPSPKNDHKDAVSLGIHVHLLPCATGDCLDPAPPSCFDRLQNGNETNVDCGGTCAPCGPGARCVVDSDCSVQRCENGRCAVANCTDGKKDGFESDVDCGRTCPTRCDHGAACYRDADCAVGTCGEPSTWISSETCQ
jgi:hypothetical protein